LAFALTSSLNAIDFTFSITDLSKLTLAFTQTTKELSRLCNGRLWP
jgi:hypothetical protein